MHRAVCSWPGQQLFVSVKREIYLTVTRQEIIVHVPLVLLVEEIRPRITYGALDGAEMTRRQHQVFSGLQRGLSNKEIGQEINISERTVKFHVSAILEKLDLHSRTQIAQRFGVEKFHSDR